MSFPTGVSDGSGSGTGRAGSPGDRPLRVRVLYGSETGNAEGVAHDLVAAVQGRGIDVSVTMLDDASPDELPGGGCVLVVTATNGDGDMPYNADRFWRALAAESAPRLDGVPFSVLGLGDTGYFDFCEAAVDLDRRFEELGAARLRPLVKCDVDFEDEAERWTNEIVKVLAALAGMGETVRPPEPTAGQPDRHRPCDATVLRSRRLTGPGSLQAVRHLELSLEGAGLSYAAGDSIGIMPSNDPALVDHLLEHLGGSGADEVDGRSLREVLTSAYEISRPSRELVEEIGRRAEDDDLVTLLAGDDRRALHEFLWARDVLDLLRLATRPPLTAPELLGLLRPLAHRSYSISSSPLVSPGQLDITVATLRYRADGRDRGGVCSTHLADRITEGDRATVVLEPNEMFRPPADDDVPMIMIGPGTGVAPFRAFLHERRARGACGGNWLFFGGRHRRCDLLYGDELTAMERDGLLDRLDLAFSRDQAEKIYVQTRMREQGKRLYGWLADGAHLYVCGDAENMAGDVDLALHEIVAEHGGLSDDEAADQVAALKRDRRYVRDVY
jgi:sulfite reductase (NADPH) flavoprotein alpha-component